MKYLIKKDVIIDYGIKEETNQKLIHPFSNILLNTNGKTDKEKVVLLDRDAIVAMVKVFKDSTFEVNYGIHWAGNKLPTSQDLTSLYFGGTGIPAVNIQTGAQVLLGDGAGMTILKDLEGFIVETDSGMIEIAGKVGNKIVIDTAKNNLIEEINKILGHLGVIDGKIAVIQSLQATHTTEIQALENQQQTNTQDLATLKPEMSTAKRAIITLNNDKEDKVDFLASQAVQDAIVANLKQDVKANTDAINLSENIDETNHPLTGTHNEATYNVTNHPGDEGPFDHKDKDEFVIYIKDPAQGSGASTSVIVGGTPQVVSLAHGGGTSETISIAIDNTGKVTVKKVAGNIDVSTLLIDRIIQESNKHGGQVTPAEFNLLKDRVVVNEVNISNGVKELQKKQSAIDNALKTSTKNIVGAINENNDILTGNIAPPVGSPFLNKTVDNITPAGETVIKNIVKPELDKKADKTTVAQKADKTYVDTELSKKADKTYVDTKLIDKMNIKGDNADYSEKGQLNIMKNTYKKFLLDDYTTGAKKKINLVSDGNAGLDHFKFTFSFVDNSSSWRQSQNYFCDVSVNGSYTGPVISLNFPQGRSAKNFAMGKFILGHNYTDKVWYLKATQGGKFTIIISSISFIETKYNKLVLENDDYKSTDKDWTAPGQYLLTPEFEEWKDITKTYKTRHWDSGDIGKKVRITSSVGYSLAFTVNVRHSVCELSQIISIPNNGGGTDILYWKSDFSDQGKVGLMYSNSSGAISHNDAQDPISSFEIYEV